MNDESKQQLFWLLTIAFLILFGAAIFFFNKDLPQDQQANLNGSKTNGRTYTVFYTSGVFSPTNLQINIGDTVRFLNDGLIPVRIVSDPQPELNNRAEFDSLSELSYRSEFLHIFSRRGIFDYHNFDKPEQAGTIIVK